MTKPKSPRCYAVRARWTDAEIETLKELYPDTLTIDLSERMGKSLQAIHHQAQKHELKKSFSFLSAISKAKLIGVGTQFPKGNIPHNKGVKGWKPGGNSEKTTFKTGMISWNKAPIGAERINDGYRQRKLTATGYPPRDWVNVHHIIWRDAGRDIPPGHLVVFKDKNPANITLDNLEMITLAENMRRNSVHNYGPEISKLYQLSGAITRQINRRKKSCQE